MLLDNNKISKIRRAVYGTTGFYVFKDFITPDEASIIKNNWTSNVAYEFHDFIKNKDIAPGSPKYLYNKPTIDDFAYCTHIWNKPIDELLHEKSLLIQLTRNQIEGKPIYTGLHESSGKALQYRVCKTVTNTTVVREHRDFFDEFRADPTGSHDFDPTRLQATLILSQYGEDYKDGGFKLTTDDNQQILFGKDLIVEPGDVVLWRYCQAHEVSGVVSLNEDVAFMRVIYPLFDTKTSEEIT